MRLRNWRVKAGVQRAFSALPGGHHLNYALQRTVGGLPYSDSSFSSFITVGQQQIDAARPHGIDPTSARSFEFGAGFDLHMPLVRSMLGLDRQLVVDIRSLARGPLVVSTYERLKDWDDPPVDWRPRAVAESGDMSSVLQAHGIEYRAPADARSVSESDGSFDLLLTTSTLEHIPESDLAAILREGHRLLRPGGLVACHIDYSDHWSHFDPTISPYNFLQYEQSEWDKLNPSLMWQNRLRHSDYLRLFDDAGFEVLSADVLATDPDARLPETLTLAPPFDRYDPTDLAKLGSFVVALRP